MLAPKAGSDPKADEPDLTGRGINQNIARLHILAKQLPFMRLPECAFARPTAKPRKLRHLHRPRKESIERFAVRIFKDERDLSASL